MRNLRAGYGPARVLQGVDLEVEEGEMVAVLGQNGAGKTTLLRALSGMVRGRGSVGLRGTELLGRAPEEVARRGVGHVPEGRGVFAPLTVEENLRVGAHLRPGSELAEDMRHVLSCFPVLRAHLSQPAGNLSGGERQMLAIGRALMARPRLLLLDEPSRGLAPLATRRLFDVLRAISTRERVAMIVVEQKTQLAAEFAARSLLMESGRLVTPGTAGASGDPSAPGARRWHGSPPSSDVWQGAGNRSVPDVWQGPGDPPAPDAWRGPGNRPAPGAGQGPPSGERSAPGRPGPWGRSHG
ncbi:ABC transporter ATP-binding protein [Planobispora takensis]|uniref:ABC transporter ATP-binding protein n=1 Tax=Planobispora takensis TaxID=1367882 RepID=UPI001EF31966|nr:ABC transporter ATP-binding protein [Planobispora takensis]